MAVESTRSYRDTIVTERSSNLCHTVIAEVQIEPIEQEDACVVVNMEEPAV